MLDETFTVAEFGSLLGWSRPREERPPKQAPDELLARVPTRLSSSHFDRGVLRVSGGGADVHGVSTYMASVLETVS